LDLSLVRTEKTVVRITVPKKPVYSLKGCDTRDGSLASVLCW